MAAAGSVKRILILAGEASGDLHGSRVVHELKKRIEGLDVFGIGGEKMQAEGMEIVFHISAMSFMGFAEVVQNIPFIRRVERTLDGLLETRRPDVVILIDYPGFNLRFAKRAKRHGLPILYYISPQVWAWHRSRVKKMKGVVDKMLVVFPFEETLYEREGIPVRFVGHPLAESIRATGSRDEFCARHKLDPQKKILALLPGSRLQEIERILPTMRDAAAELKNTRQIQPVLGVASNLGRDVIQRYSVREAGITLVEKETYNLMSAADAAIVTSGTATLETGWFGTPMAVVYKTSAITYLIGRMLVAIPYVGLVNIVAGKGIVPELIQGKLTTKNLVTVVGKMLADETYAAGIRTELSIIKEKLSGEGASSNVAEEAILLGEAA